MSLNQREWWDKLRAYAEETVRLFSEGGRTAREKMVVAEFLRHLGVGFTDDELTVPATDDDVDVHFRTARFQNAERIDGDRRRHTEYRQFAERVTTARDVSALEMPFPESTPLPVEELLHEVATALEKKNRKTVNRAALDALVYMNLRGRHLYPVPALIADAGTIAELGWRSVSVLSPPFAAVVFAEPSAPAFLRERVGRVSQVAGIPWEGGVQPARSGIVRGLAGKVVAWVAVAGYVALGGIVLLARTVGEIVATVGSWLGVRHRYLHEVFGHLYAGKQSIWFYKKWSEGYRHFNQAARAAVGKGLTSTASFDLRVFADSCGWNSGGLHGIDRRYNGGSIIVSTLRRRYSSSRRPYARRCTTRILLLRPSTKPSATLFSGWQ